MIGFDPHWFLRIAMGGVFLYHGLTKNPTGFANAFGLPLVVALLVMFAEIAGEGLMIIGWVMLWQPLEIFLYGWWPLLGSIRLYQRLEIIPVEFELQ